MKTSSSLHRFILALSLGLLVLAASHASAQTVITSVPYTINASGEYKLGGNLNNNNVNQAAIQINAPNVILDLDGFFVAGPGNPALTGSSNSVISVGNYANVTIKNGTVAGGTYGIYYSANNSATTSRNYVVESVTVTRCYLGGVYFGGAAAPGSLIQNCVFSTLGGSTSTANTSPSAIRTLGGLRIEDNIVSGVTATGTGSSIGISALGGGDFAVGNTISNCGFGLLLVSKYLDNLTYNVDQPFSGGVNATGNN